MKTKSLSLRSKLWAFAMLAAHVCSAQTFQTVDDFNFASGSIAMAMGRDPIGNVYAAGFGVGGYAGIRKSTDGGATWDTIGFFQSPSNPNYAAISSDSAGNLYAAGTHDYRWFVTRSSDGGTTWSEVDFVATASWSPRHAATDSAGNVYVVGQASSAWVVRKGIGGVSWSTVDAFNPSDFGHAKAVLCHPAGIFVAGQGNVTVKRVSTPYWFVRRSQDGGATWTTVDTVAGGTPGFGGITSDAAGNIYVVGSAPYWLVRKSADGGATWITLDHFQPPCVTTVISTKPYRTQTTCPYSRAVGVAADSAGNLFVAGVTGSPNGARWVVRKSAAGTGPWETVDDFQYTAGKESWVYGIVADDAGHVFVAGDGYDSTGMPRWLVRRN